MNNTNLQVELKELKTVLSDCKCPIDRVPVFLKYFEENGDLSNELSDELFDYIETDLDEMLEESSSWDGEISEIKIKLKEISDTLNKKLFQITQELHSKIKLFIKGITNEVEAMISKDKQKTNNDIDELLSL